MTLPELWSSIWVSDETRHEREEPVMDNQNFPLLVVSMVTGETALVVDSKLEGALTQLGGKAAKCRVFRVSNDCRVIKGKNAVRIKARVCVDVPNWGEKYAV